MMIEGCRTEIILPIKKLYKIKAYKNNIKQTREVKLFV